MTNKFIKKGFTSSAVKTVYSDNGRYFSSFGLKYLEV